MINKALFRQVQAFRRKGYSKASIVKALEFDPKTVAKYFAMEEEGYRAYRQDQLYRDKVFDSYRKEILEVYEANSFRKLEVASVYDYLEEKYGELPADENQKRPQSALGNTTPMEFAAQVEPQKALLDRDLEAIKNGLANSKSCLQNGRETECGSVQHQKTLRVNLLR
jgi:hypothetical protein